MSRTVINERYSMRTRGFARLVTFPPHIFEGATNYQVHVGPVSLHFAGRAPGLPKSNTVVHIGSRVVIVIPRGFTRDEWTAYITIEREDES